MEDRPGHGRGLAAGAASVGADHRLEKACNPVLESEREAPVSHWAGSCHPQTHAACKMPALEPGPLPALPSVRGFWRLRPASPIPAPPWLPLHAVPARGGKCQGLEVRALGRRPGSAPTSGLTPPSHCASGSLSPPLTRSFFHCERTSPGSEGNSMFGGLWEEGVLGGVGVVGFSHRWCLKTGGRCD